MKRAFLVLAIALILTFGSVTSSSAWVYVPNYGSTGWSTYSYTSTQGSGDWINGATLTFGVTNVGDTLLDSKLLVDNVWVKCNASNPFYEHYNDSFEGTMWSSTGIVNKVSSSNAYGGSPTYNPTDGSFMAELTATASIISGGFDWHGPASLGGYGPTTLYFDWNFLGMDYVPYTDYSYAILKDAAGIQLAYFELGKIGAAVPEPMTMLLLGFGLLGLAGLRKRD